MLADILSFIGRMWCGLRGHDLMLDFQPNLLREKCYQCGYESPGWEISNTSKPIQKVPPQYCVCGDGWILCNCAKGRV